MERKTQKPDQDLILDPNPPKIKAVGCWYEMGDGSPEEISLSHHSDLHRDLDRRGPFIGNSDIFLLQPKLPHNLWESCHHLDH